MNSFNLGNFNFKPKVPKPEHLEKVLKVLSVQRLMSVPVIAKQSGVSLTSVRCALAQLEEEGKIEVVVQKVTPKLGVRLKAVSVTGEVLATSSSSTHS